MTRARGAPGGSRGGLAHATSGPSAQSLSSCWSRPTRDASTLPVGRSLIVEFDFEAAVDVAFAEDLNYHDMAPVLDAFGATGVFRVYGTRVGWSGPAGGGPEIGIILTAVLGVGAAAFAKTFCEELAKDSYKAVRAALVGVVGHLRNRDPET